MLDRPLFTGSVEHSLDDKGRLVVPARFRERLGAGFFLTIAEPDPYLWLEDIDSPAVLDWVAAGLPLEPEGGYVA